jgi:hypothetical protein
VTPTTEPTDSLSPASADSPQQPLNDAGNVRMRPDRREQIGHPWPRLTDPGGPSGHRLHPAWEHHEGHSISERGGGGQDSVEARCGVDLGTWYWTPRSSMCPRCYPNTLCRGGRRGTTRGPASRVSFARRRSHSAATSEFFQHRVKTGWPRGAACELNSATCGVWVLDEGLYGIIWR